MAITGIVLAAGTASRMGRNKLLLELEGEPLLRRAVRRALEAGLSPVLVVLGHQADLARGALTGLPCLVVENPAHAAGMNTSLSAGVLAAPSYAEAAVVLLADMPFVEPAMIRAVVARFRETGAPVVSSRYGAVPAPPTLYARAVFGDLTGGTGEGRGRQVVRAHGAVARFVDWPAEALGDLDVPQDVERARRRLASGSGA